MVDTKLAIYLIKYTEQSTVYSLVKITHFSIPKKNLDVGPTQFVQKLFYHDIKENNTKKINKNKLSVNIANCIYAP